MTVVFARTRHTYDSYRDLWRLVDAARFPVVFVDEIHPADDTKTYIFTPINGEVMGLLESWRIRRARIVWWNLERPEDTTLSSSLDKVSGCVDAVWVSDRGFAARDRRFSYVPVAGHVDFGTRTGERLYDVCPLAYLWGRRQDVAVTLARRGVRVTPEAWNRDGQDQIVAKSHLVLNMHQYETAQIVAPLRFAVAASYAIPIVSEPFDDVLARKLVVCESPIPVLLSTTSPHGIHRLLKLPVMLATEGNLLHRTLCVETNFGREVEIAAGKVGT